MLSDPHKDERGGDEVGDRHLTHAKFIHIAKAARSATAANVLAPLLCIPMFESEVQSPRFAIWLSYMALAIAIRTLIIHRLDHLGGSMAHAQRDLRKITFAVGIVGLGWGLGWPLMTPDLSLVNRMIYVYMTTAAMISSMFAYSVDRPTFYSFTLPIMVPAVSTIVWPTNIFPWPFLVGMTALYFVVLSIARNFSLVFDESVKLRFRNESLYQALANERDQSIAANIAKSEFIAAASHDLRQPLHAVNINIELFKESELRERDAYIVRRIKGSVVALNNMFEALLDMNKLDAHFRTTQNSVFMLRQLADDIRDIVEHQAVNKGLSYRAEVPDCAIRGDRLLLQQLLINLVMNAVQYTRTGFVALRCENAAGCLKVEVLDSGVGIAPGDMDKIFQEFYRADSTRHDHEGLGLGLPIVKKICQLMDASISVDSQPGRGSVFTLQTRCPVVDAAQWQDLPAVAVQPATDSAAKLKGKTIAVIEDDPVITEAYRDTLLAEGAHVVVLSEAEDDMLLKLQDIDRIDCILSDYRLQKTSGDQLIAQIRESYNLDIPAVIVTGDTSPTQTNGLDQFNALVMYKPITLQRILEALAQAMEAARPKPSDESAGKGE